MSVCLHDSNLDAKSPKRSANRETYAMSAGWYYMASGWLRKGRRVGPISEADLLMRIDQGKISPETLLQSAKTKGKWVPMNSVGPAMKRWRKSHPDEE